MEIRYQSNMNLTDPKTKNKISNANLTILNITCMYVKKLLLSVCLCLMKLSIRQNYPWHSYLVEGPFKFLNFCCSFSAPANS